MGIYSQDCATITIIDFRTFRTFSSSPKKSHNLQQSPSLSNHNLSLFMDLSILDIISYKWSHTARGPLWLASFTQQNVFKARVSVPAWPTPVFNWKHRCNLYSAWPFSLLLMDWILHTEASYMSGFCSLSSRSFQCPWWVLWVLAPTFPAIIWEAGSMLSVNGC